MFQTTLSQTISKDLIRELTPTALAGECKLLVSEGQRLLTFYASPGPLTAQTTLTLILMSESGSLTALCTHVQSKGTYPSFLPEQPSFHVFEREIFEQTGVLAEGNPWLKPLRFPEGSPTKPEEYPFFSMEGKEVHEVGVGPVHAGVIEPGHFRFMCYGETVHHLEIQLGYQHRGVEALLHQRDPKRLAILVESIAGDSSVGHVTAYCRALEQLCGLDCGTSSTLVRSVAVELERIAMHLAGLAGMAADIAYLPGASTYARLRTAVINLSMRLSGSRFGRCWIRPGGVKYGIDREQVQDIIRTLTKVRDDAEIIHNCMFTSKTVIHRLKGTGRLSRELAQDIGLVGMIARSCGVPVDLRRRGIIANDTQRTSVEDLDARGGDCLARALIRKNEIFQSINEVIEALQGKTDIPGELKALGGFKPESLVISAVEGWRGEIIHCMETDENGRIRNYHIQDPSLRNWFGLAQAMRSNAISDFPICNKSFDLSYCGNDL